MDFISTLRQLELAPESRDFIQNFPQKFAVLREMTKSIVDETPRMF